MAVGQLGIYRIMNMKIEEIEQNSIIALEQFIQSTRDSGYKSTASAISELVDNSLQAGAASISIQIVPDYDNETDLRVAVLDDGCGMDKHTLTQAMRFGGSSRYNSRQGLGRFGMGLPNASLSQAKSINVYTWQRAGKTTKTYIDVDEIASGAMKSIPSPKEESLPYWVDFSQSESGTLVTWENCDRLDHKRISTIERKLHSSLGKIFRYFIWGGSKISINGQEVKPIDPLYLHKNSPYSGAQLFDEVIEIEVYADADDPLSETSTVKITFTLLPIHEWCTLSNDEKRQYGITKNAGVSIVRGDREVDYGWFFMGGKRKENYDDWWRCEIKFDPILDDAFGITHTKQQIKPKEYILDAIQSHTESMAKHLNNQVRHANLNLKTSNVINTAADIAEKKDKFLTPIKQKDSSSDPNLEALVNRHPALKLELSKKVSSGVRYHLVEDDLVETCFFKPYLKDGIIVGVINPRHRFYKKIFKPLLDGKIEVISDIYEAIQLMIMAAARAEITLKSKEKLDVLSEFRTEWSQAMDALLSGK